MDDLENWYVCSSGSWSIMARASSVEEAAAKALQQHMESGAIFNLGAKIFVVQVELAGEEQELDSPSVLADLGFHKLSKDLSKAIKDDN